MSLSDSVAIFLGLLLARSALTKLRQPLAFWSILQRYPAGAWFRTAKVAGLVPALELMLAVALLAPFQTSRLLAAYGMLAFIVLASAGIYARYRRGEERFVCGCSGNLEEETTVPTMMLRNAVLLVAVVYALSARWPPVAPLDYAMGLALLFAFDLFQAALIQNERIRKWTTPPKSP